MREDLGLGLTGTRSWWRAKKGDVHLNVLPYVRAVENFQAELFDKFCKLEATYDTNPRTQRVSASVNLVNRVGRVKAVVTENLIARNVDIVAANVADSDIRCRIETDGADWSHQRTAKRLERYLDGLSRLFDVGPKCRRGFKHGASLKGTGLNKVWIDEFDQIRVTPVPIDNVVVDELECRDGHPKHLHYRDFFDREEMQAQFPDYAEQIEKAQSSGNWKLWAGYRPMRNTEVIVIESWRLPIGPKGHPRYVPGRHTLCIDGGDLLDEEYHKPHYPFAKMVWNDPCWGFYGISLAERILPHQNLLNRRNYQINRSLDLKADPVTYIPQIDAALAVKTVNQIGTLVPFRGAQPPITVDHQAVGQETYNSRIQIKQDASEEALVNRQMAGGGVPAGIESGVGVREVRTTNTQPFSPQEKAFERFWLDTLWLILDCCRDLGGTKAPDIIKVSKYGNERIKWSEVDMDDLKIEMMAASTLADSPAGRQQRVVELAQAGVITLDEARELADHPDIERIMSLYNATMESIENVIERVERGERNIMPEPFDNLQLGCVMLQREYNRIKVVPDVPEDILEALADWIALASNELNPPAPPPGMGPPGMGPPGGPVAPAPPGMPNANGPAQASATTFAPGAFAPMTA